MNWMAGIAVNLLVPLLGIIAYVLLCRRMLLAQIPSPPFFSYFLLFAIVGGWLMILLTELFWLWSGLASLGAFFLILVAPFLCVGIALRLRGRRTLSTFHRGAYIASLVYSCVGITAAGVWLGYLAVRG